MARFPYVMVPALVLFAKAKFRNKEFCYAITTGITIGGWYCLYNGRATFDSLDDGPKCVSSDNSPVLLIKEDKYANLCGSNGYPVTYKHFTNEIGDHRPDVHCSNSTPYVCTYTENQDTEVVYPEDQVTETTDSQHQTTEVVESKHQDTEVTDSGHQTTEVVDSEHQTTEALDSGHHVVYSVGSTVHILSFVLSPLAVHMLFLKATFI